MARVMIFIDGTWLYSNLARLRAASDESFHIDFGKLPAVLCEKLSVVLPGQTVDLVRVSIFGSFAVNYDPVDEDIVRKRREFFQMLSDEHRYDVELYPVDFLGRRVKRSDRTGDDSEIDEKCVDVALASSLLYYGAIPSAYDIALAVVGDRDFVPALKKVRLLGKRIVIGSIAGSCAGDLSEDPPGERVRDFDVIWINEITEEIRLKYQEHILRCESPFHEGDRMVKTTYHPKGGQKFFCALCREVHNRQRYVSKPAHAAIGTVLRGQVTKIVLEKGYGFASCKDKGDYFFHRNTLSEGLFLESLSEGMQVEFEVGKPAGHGKAASALNVRIVKDETTEDPEHDQRVP